MNTAHASWCAWLTDSCDCTCTPEDVTGELADRVEALEASAQSMVSWAHLRRARLPRRAPGRAAVLRRAS